VQLLTFPWFLLHLGYPIISQLEQWHVVALHLFGVHEVICTAAVIMGKGTVHMSHISSICICVDNTQITFTDITGVTEPYNSSVSTRKLAALYVLQL